MQRTRIDLSVLDPSTEARRWEALSSRVADQAWEARAPRPSIPDLIVHWWGRSLGLAAAAAAAVWIVALSYYSPTGKVDAAGSSTDAAWQLAGWASSRGLPGTSQVLLLMAELEDDE